MTVPPHDPPTPAAPPRRVRTIRVETLARVEGEGSLHLDIEGDKLLRAQLRIFEPPRFFEAFLRGREFTEAPDITARICGICPVAYLLSSCNALESLCGVQVPSAIADLRRLLYCGEWIESHTLHMFLLHVPDFLGYPDSIRLAQDRPDLVKGGLRLKKLGNAIMAALGGREIHPINVKVGGFYRAPTPLELAPLRAEIPWALDFCEQTIETLCQFEYPDFEQDYEFAALRHPSHYPMEDGRLVSTAGVDVPVSQYDQVFEEFQEPHSTSLHTRATGRGAVHLGPLARFALCRQQLTPRAAQAADFAELGAICRNPFRSLLVRMVEVILALEESARLIDAYKPPTSPSVPVPARPGTGYGATEAPRGICYQRYTIDGDGLIQGVKIVAPTSVNQAVIESDLHHFASSRLHLSDEQLQWQCEQAIRNYDPCISCSCHFLRLTVNRR